MAKQTRYKQPEKANKGIATFSDRHKEDTLKIQVAEFTIHLFFSFIFYIVVIGAILQLGQRAYDFAYPIFGDAPVAMNNGKDVRITIEKEESLQAVVEDLERKGLIKDSKSFYIRCKLSLTKKKNINPGTYTLNTSQNYNEIIQELTTSEENEEKE